MTNPVFDQAIERGLTAHQSNKFDEALTAYREALEILPDDAEAASLCGLALTHLGRFADAGPLHEKAVTLEPDQAGFRLNLLENLERSGDLERAEKQVEKILALAPQMTRAWEKRGDLHILREAPADAAVAYTRALSLDAPHFALALKLARLQMNLRNLREAVGALDVAATFGPQDATVFDLRCSILAELRDWPALEIAAGLWAAAHPTTSAAWRRLAEATFELGRFRQSVAAFAKVLELAPRSADRLAAYAQICLQALEFDKAHQALEEAEALDPNQADVLAAKGLLLTYRGQFDEAEAYCRRCLAADPEFVNAYTQLTRLTGGHLSDDEIATLDAFAGDSAKPAENRVVARFALGHGYDARDDIARAFANYRAANELMRKQARAEGLLYDRDQSRQRTDRLLALFSSAVPSEGDSPQGLIPLFIVGMPRSGTTLIESVLGAHSEVIAGGERPLMRQILDTYLTMSAESTRPGSSVLREWAALYLAETPQESPAHYTTDKNPLNIEAVGLIARLFPAARIIHVRRNPVETGFSIYRQELSKFWTFANALEDIGHFYGQYARLADHWEKTLGDRFTTIQYERFAATFDQSARELVTGCGLRWEDACTDYQNRIPEIATFSAVQARERVAVRLGKGQTYEAHLQPLVDAMRLAGVDLETGELANATN